MKKFVLILGLLLVLNLQTKLAKGNNQINYDHSTDNKNIINIVEKFKTLIATNNPHIISKYVKYPFNIGDNCPDIQNKEEFVQNFDIIFDSLLTTQIMASDINLWNFNEKQNVIFYDSPYVQLSTDGYLMDIEYTAKRTQNNKKCVLEEKSKIYPSLKKYQKNLYTLKTYDHIYRIDLTNKGLSATTYRLAIWKKEQKMSEKPLIIINNGKLKLYGSANNEKYIFEDKEISYIVEINTARALETIPIEITVINNFSAKKYPAVNITNSPNLY